MLTGFGAFGEEKKDGGIVEWWTSQETSVKVILGLSAVAVVGGLIYAFTGKPKTAAKPNGRRHRRIRRGRHGLTMTANRRPRRARRNGKRKARRARHLLGR